MSPQEKQTERERAAAASLTEQYRSIGPAAILAALVCTEKKPGARTQTTVKAA